MPVYEHEQIAIHYDDEGDGFPVLLIAPGGMRSANDVWNTTPWNPRAALGGEYRLIGMDQRNAGRSTAPISPGDGWATYRGDQLGLLDHLGIDRCHVLGMCIGGPYIMGLLRAAPERFESAVLLQPVGIDDNRGAFEEMFEGWVAEIGPAHPSVSDDDWASFRRNMWDGEFVLTATPAEAAAVETPMLVLMGNDLYHPRSTSRALVAAAPNATLIEQWKEPEHLATTDAAIKDFLAEHTPR
ncbi:MAG: alpha/beta hydrolase [Ilumatobacter sp.]|uniref:alpha/beta fold hydrolase n=1 Tax=Ilumatobacter sp. TaxID=1967498 RepID=UPI00262AB53B|nr:alpha/beta hydrolase [Ilumatobacter sp.]MDJ0767601.1 alpha/beta hydrolase [Ilumatobacter sp.]